MYEQSPRQTYMKHDDPQKCKNQQLTWNWKESLSAPPPKCRYQTAPSSTSCCVKEVVAVTPRSSPGDGRQPSGGPSAGMDTSTTSPGQKTIQRPYVVFFPLIHPYVSVQRVGTVLRSPVGGEDAVDDVVGADSLEVGLQVFSIQSHHPSFFHPGRRHSQHTR